MTGGTACLADASKQHGLIGGFRSKIARWTPVPGIELIVNDTFAGLRRRGFRGPVRHPSAGTGVQIMHGLLVSVLEYIRSTGRSVIEPQPYCDALQEALLELEGDTSNGDVVRGADFWLAGGEGAAGSYSSNAGRRVLTAKLRGALPAIEVE